MSQTVSRHASAEQPGATGGVDLLADSQREAAKVATSEPAGPASVTAQPPERTEPPLQPLPRWQRVENTALDPEVGAHWRAGVSALVPARGVRKAP